MVSVTGCIHRRRSGRGTASTATDHKLQSPKVIRNMGVSRIGARPGFSIINQPFWGSPILGNPHRREQKLRCLWERSAERWESNTSKTSPNMMGQECDI